MAGDAEGSWRTAHQRGSTATLTAVVAARHAMCDDPARLARAVLYTSDQAHSSVTRAAWIAGLPRDHIRAVPVDGEWRMKPDELQKAITQDRNAGLLPVAVVASAGTTNTGAVDPLVAIADLCKREGLWFHVDAAYGGFTVLTDHGRRMLDGIGLADSITLDPHKWLFVPFECGCLMVQDPARLRQAFHILPEYLEALDTAAEEVNFADLGEQLSRYSRALQGLALRAVLRNRSAGWGDRTGDSQRGNRGGADTTGAGTRDTLAGPAWHTVLSGARNWRRCHTGRLRTTGSCSE